MGFVEGVETVGEIVTLRDGQHLARNVLAQPAVQRPIFLKTRVLVELEAGAAWAVVETFRSRERLAGDGGVGVQLLDTGT